MKSKSENLRYRTALLTVDDKQCRVTIITRIRGDRWLVEGRDLPKRFVRPYAGYDCRRMTTELSSLTLLPKEEESTRRVLRPSRDPIEAMIDRACGL